MDLEPEHWVEPREDVVVVHQFGTGSNIHAADFSLDSPMGFGLLAAQGPLS